MTVVTDDNDVTFVQVTPEEQEILRQADEVMYRFLNMANDTNSGEEERKGIRNARIAIAQLGGY